jgi:hypothetical protein
MSKQDDSTMEISAARGFSTLNGIIDLIVNIIADVFPVIHNSIVIVLALNFKVCSMAMVARSPPARAAVIALFEQAGAP